MKASNLREGERLASRFHTSELHMQISDREFAQEDSTSFKHFAQLIRPIARCACDSLTQQDYGTLRLGSEKCSAQLLATNVGLEFGPRKLRTGDLRRERCQPPAGFSTS